MPQPRIPGTVCGSSALPIDQGTLRRWHHFSVGPVCAEQLGTPIRLDAIRNGATSADSELNLDKDGIAHNARILEKTPAGKPSVSGNLEHGKMASVDGVIVHQTGGAKISSTFNSYSKPKADGAHFLIDKDGTIYQTAALNRVTWHVGKLKSRCMAEHDCSAAEAKLNKHWNPTAMHHREVKKPAGERYPSNNDAIGIELVGAAVDVKGGNKQVYETVTSAQNASLKWLVAQLEAEFKFAKTEVFRHPTVSRKNATEASTAKWQ